MGSLHVLGLPSRRLSVALLLGVLVALALVRTAAFPASIWDQDEAYLALAVVDFDPSALRPHPPWFPLWVVVGKLLAPLSSDPALGLRIVSAVAGVWLLFPLTALNAIWLRRPLAASAALLYLILPGPWFLAGRALSDTPATFLLVASSAWWLRRRPRLGDLGAGSAAGGLCLLVRPQLAPAILVLAAWRLVSARQGRQRWWIVGPFTAIVACGAAATVLASGGGAALAAAFLDHVAYHVGGLPSITYEFADSGFARCLIRWEPAAMWLAGTVGGLAVWARHRVSAGSPWPLLFGLLVPLAVATQVLANPAHARYALPLLALTSGPVVIAASTILRRWTVLVLLALVTVTAWFGLEQTRVDRGLESPPISGLRDAGRWAESAQGVVVVDRTLVVFADYMREAGELKPPIINDFQLEIGSVAAPPAASTVAVYAVGRGGFVRSAETVILASARPGWVRRLGPDRLMDVRIARRSQVMGRPRVE
jgi:hypothetical protein